MFTLGESPYPGLDNDQVIRFIKAGNRMDQPQRCPPEIYELMCKCWERNPDARPYFSQAAHRIELILEAKGKEWVS